MTKLTFASTKDLLAYLGTTWCVYVAPPDPGDGKARDKSDPTAYVLLAGVKDAAAFRGVLDTMVSRLNEQLGNLEFDGGDPGEIEANKNSPRAFLEKLPAPHVGYRLTSRAAARLDLGDGVQPTIMLGKSFLAVAATPDLASEALAAEFQADCRWKPTGKLVNAFDSLPDDLTLLVVADHRSSGVPEKIAALPSLTQMIINMSQEEDLEDASPWCLLDMIGLPRPGGFQIKIDRSQIPKADDLHPFLFPSILAGTVDERGCRLISCGAFPFALLANETEVHFSLKCGMAQRRGLQVQGEDRLHYLRFRPDRLVICDLLGTQVCLRASRRSEAGGKAIRQTKPAIGDEDGAVEVGPGVAQYKEGQVDDVVDRADPAGRDRGPEHVADLARERAGAHPRCRRSGRGRWR